MYVCMYVCNTQLYIRKLQLVFDDIKVPRSESIAIIIFIIILTRTVVKSVGFRVNTCGISTLTSSSEVC